MMLDRLQSSLRRLVREEDGAMSVLNIFLTVATCAIGAVALDVTHFYAARSQLQVAADLGAHSALYTRRYGDYTSGNYRTLTDAQAKTAAITAVEYGLPESIYGDTIDENDIVIGSYDWDTGEITPDSANPEAAGVRTHRSGSSAVGSLLFNIVGINSMDVSSLAVFTLGPGECNSDQGFFSQKEVQINGNNTFRPGFCIATPKFWVRNQNTFRPGVTVMVPSLSGLDLSGSNVNTHNPGLTESLQFDTMSLTSTLNLINNDNAALPEDFRSHAYAYSLLAQPAWSNVVTNLSDAANYHRVTITTNSAVTVTPVSLATNTVHVYDCQSKNGNIVLSNSGSDNTFKNMVIITNCPVNFGGSVKLEDVVVSSTSTSKTALQAPNSMTGFTIGKNDNCAPGGGAALITRGGVDLAAGPNYYGAHVRAGGNVDFQSNGVGQGISVISGDTINTTSNGDMAVCGPGAGTLSRDVSLRLVR